MPALSNLSLHRNELKDEGASHIARAMAAACGPLRVVRLDWNQVCVCV